jgi:uncharacterized membrane protein
MLHGIRIALLALVTGVVACNGGNEVPRPAERLDETAIDDVWHKAKLRGVAFRAIGQEPGWLLEITNGKEILLVTDYGEHRMSLPYVEPVVFQDESRTEYRLPDHDTVVEIRGEPCTDSMSGEQFAVSVTVSQPDRTLVGCGRALF